MTDMLDKKHTPIVIQNEQKPSFCLSHVRKEQKKKTKLRRRIDKHNNIEIVNEIIKLKIMKFSEFSKWVYKKKRKEKINNQKTHLYYVRAYSNVSLTTAQ